MSNYRILYGDIHNHNAHGYGVGSIERSLDIARTHLDWAESLIGREQFDAAHLHLAAARTAIGDLDLPDNQRRLDALASQL